MSDKIKITDLSVGDWVQDKNGTKAQILGIENQSDGYVLNVRIKGIDIGCIRADTVYPIPITPEILEKNGCEQLENWNNPTRLSYATDDYYATGWMGKDNWNCGVHNDNIDELVIIAKAKYVHELQHALRLAGNTREIEL
jgi:hypothetical protein